MRRRDTGMRIHKKLGDEDMGLPDTSSPYPIGVWGDRSGDALGRNIKFLFIEIINKILGTITEIPEDTARLAALGGDASEIIGGEDYAHG